MFSVDGGMVVMEEMWSLRGPIDSPEQRLPRISGGVNSAGLSVLFPVSKQS